MYFKRLNRFQNEVPPVAAAPDPIEGICPPGLTLLYAQPNLGKSYLALTLGRAVAKKEDEILSFYIGQNRPVLYFALDDTMKTLNERFADLQIDSDDFFVVDERDYRLAKDAMRMDGFDGSIVNFIVNEIRIQQGVIPGLIIVDTWEKIRDTSDHDYSSEVEELAPLKRKAEELGYNILLVHHANKYGASKSNKFADFYGSNGVAGETNVLMKLEGTPTSDIFLLSVEGNSYRGLPEIYLTREDDGSFRICRDEDLDLTPDVPERDFSKIRKYMVLNARATPNKQFSYCGPLGQFAVDADLECSNKGVSNLLRKYKKSFEEDGITYWIERPNHHKGSILHISCDLSD